MTNDTQEKPPAGNGRGSLNRNQAIIAVLAGVLATIVFAGVGWTIASLTSPSGDDDDEPAAEVITSIDEPLGDEHIISVAEGLGVRDELPDDMAIKLGGMVCDYLDETDGDFQTLDDMILDNSSSADTAVEMGVVAYAGVPAYCPHWLDDMLAWTES